MRRKRHLFKKVWTANEKFRFLTIGAWNTFFGYISFVALYLVLHDHLHYLLILLIAYIPAVVQAYLMQRWLVFRSSNPMAGEFTRFNTSQLGSIAFSIAGMWLLVDFFGVSPLVAQAIVIPANVVLTYLAHRQYSFESLADNARANNND